MRALLIGTVKMFRAPIWQLRAVIAKLYLAVLGAEVGEGLTLYSLPFCRRHPKSTIRIGRNVTIYNRLIENPAGVSRRTVLLTLNAGSRLEIGDHVGLSGATLYCGREIVIEDYVNLGAGVMVFDTDHHPIDHMARRVHDVSQIASAPVRICRDAFVGANSIILKGVTIGERSIVGAGSVVTKDVPPDCVVGGSPARILKTLAPRSLLEVV